MAALTFLLSLLHLAQPDKIHIGPIVFGAAPTVQRWAPPVHDVAPRNVSIWRP